MKKKYIFWPVVLSLFTGIILIGLLFLVYQNWNEDNISLENDVAKLVRTNKEEKETNLKTIIHEAQKSVVQIEAENESGQNIGSGFIFNEKGDIITNAHVVQDADSIFVKTSDARTYPAALVGIGENEDVAVLRVPQLVDRSTLPIDGDFEGEIGDDIIAVGSPLGFQNTVTIGIISGKNRNFTVEEGYDYQGLYQISAPITNGNSGGPLIHRQTGNIIAINSAGSKEGQIGFSLPLHEVIDLVNMWSDQADDQELNYNTELTTYEQVDEEQLKQDANYIVNYFFENLEMRDYLNAYTLLGSDLQNQKTYQDFRKEYVHVNDLSINNVETEMTSSHRVQITLNADHISRKDKQIRLTEHYKSTFVIGYENDQLKILEQERELLSTTEQELTVPEEQ
ncbi:S1C family serine protease [Salinibacillus xinjiangensis]|uniref:S1C family serine protease n=1 Tax=Salinibacillus xinjiangensis TaxID=1229268 RepID=UPI001891EE8D|nr:trypsin-like peptidase domain-containing protein [Salinibacillus xinjiangensis]